MGNSMTKDEELAKHMALIEQYKEQLSQLETQYSYVQAAINEYTKARMTIEQLSKVEDGSDILVPVGGSTFIDATAKKTSNVLFDVGAGIVLERPVDDTIKKIDERIESLQKTQEKISSTAQQIQDETTETSVKAQKLMGEGKE